MTWFYRIFRGLVTFFTAIWSRQRTMDRDNIPAEGGAVLVCNHRTIWDMITVAGLTRRYICFVAKKELENTFFVGYVLRQVHAVCIDRSKPDIPAIRAMLSNLKDGNLMLIFPEGTRNRDPENVPLLPLQEGAAMMALRANVPLIPIWVHGRYNPIRGIRVRVGKPVDLDDFRKEKKPDLRAATERIEDAMLELRALCING